MTHSANPMHKNGTTIVLFEQNFFRVPVFTFTVTVSVSHVPAKGIEPLNHPWHQDLNLARIPFRHAGKCRTLPIELHTHEWM